MAYQNLDVRPPEVRWAFEQACKEGGSTFYSTGVNPGFIVERLAMTATGASNAISSVKVEEFVRIGTEPEDTLKAFGFGVPKDESGRKSGAAQIAEQYERQFIHYLGKAFGTPVTGLDYSVKQFLAPRDIQAPTMIVPKDTVAYLQHRWEGKTESGPKIIFMVYWYMSDEVKPDNVPCEDFYLITIEGRPSVRLAVELRASFDPNTRCYPNDPTVPTFYVTAVAMIQAIPSVITGAPGVRAIDPPSNAYWKADLRK
jgi:4-hydroxy-tetrahydrodipicolinate reductase